MTFTRKLTALLAVASLLCALWVPVAVSAEVAQPQAAVATAPQAVAAPKSATDPLDAPLELLAVLENGDKLCAVYRQIIDAIKNGVELFYFEGGYTLNETEQAILQSVVDATLPESYGDYIGHSYCTVSDSYFYSGFYSWGLTEDMKAAADDRANDLIADLYEKSDYEKSLILYERLGALNTYDYGNYHQTAYGPLVEGMSVCAGYARTYQMLLQKLGIPCLYISGEAFNGVETGGHAWNLVMLDGEWYYSDATWDDYDWPSYPMGVTYFNVTYAKITQDHFADSEYELWLPHSTATACNYYAQSGQLVSGDMTLEQLIEIFKKQNPATLYFADNYEQRAQAVLELFFNNLEAIAAGIGKGDCLGWMQNIAYDYSHVTLGMYLDHEHTYKIVVAEPTCTDYGFIDYACTECPNTYFELLNPLAHTFGVWMMDENTHARFCDVCGTREDFGEHTYHQNGTTCDTCGYEPGPTPEVILGDTNGDGKVNNRDLGLLQRYLNEIETDIALTAADLNGDGKVNNRDLGLLQRKLNSAA